MTALTPAMFDILAALAAGPLHGYAIARRILDMRATPDAKPMGPATLYTSLEKLLDAGLIEEVSTPDSDSRRRSYRLTQAGLSAFARALNQQRVFLDAAQDCLPKNAGVLR